MSKDNGKIKVEYLPLYDIKVADLNPKDHDKIFALTSHLPHLIAYNLIKTAQDFQKKQKKNIIK